MSRLPLHNLTSLKPRFKLCTFDVTNTLLKFETTVGEQYAKVGRIYGVEREPDRITTAFQHQWKIMNTNHPNFGCSTGLTSYLWWKEMVRRTFSVESQKLTDKQLEAISNHLYEIYKGSTCWKVVPGAESLLKRLKRSHIILGVISNFDERLETVLESFGLKSYFDFILASYLVQAAKPSKKIFDLALVQSSSIASKNALHIGDNIKLDYLAAKEAGWNALLISDESANTESLQMVNPSEIVNNIDEIEDYIFST